MREFLDGRVFASTEQAQAEAGIRDGEELIKTVLRTNDKEVRKKHAARAS